MYSVTSRKHPLGPWLKFLALLTIILSGCSTAPQPRTEISATIHDNAYQPSAWRVPAGQQITLDLINEDTVDHDWTVMMRNVTAPFSADDGANIYWSVRVPAGSSLSATFQAPAAAANYPVVCTTPGHLEDGMLAHLTVVQPGNNP